MDGPVMAVGLRSISGRDNWGTKGMHGEGLLHDRDYIVGDVPAVLGPMEGESLGLWYIFQVP